MSDLIRLPNAFYGSLVPAIFLRRLHRFAALVEINGAIETVHIPNSGRLKELLFEGNIVHLHFEGHPGRQTRYTLVATDVPTGQAFIDSRLPNRILARNWRDLPPLMQYDKAWPEVAYGRSRFDLALKSDQTEELALLEAKCVTLVCEDTGYFPDAPSERGRKHLLELAQAKGEGYRGIVVFFAQHPLATQVRASTQTDPSFAEAMSDAFKAGIDFFGFRTIIKADRVEIKQIPVLAT